MKHIFLVGAKSLGAYGGYETFVYKLTEYHQDEKRFCYHVACKANGDGCMDETKLEGVTKPVVRDGKVMGFTFHNARCFKIHVPQILGPAQAIYYDCKALDLVCEYVKQNHIQDFIVYIMACRIGPFMKSYYSKIHKLGGKVYLNPDGHEWKRAKWNAAIRKYWKWSEQLMVKYSDLVICDSINIEHYIQDSYGIKETDFIAYGAETRASKLADNDADLLAWYAKHGLSAGNYYLVVGRFVPENNYETMIREFMQSKTTKDFAIVTNVNDKFLNELEEKLHYRSDSRIKFVGTVYDQEMIKKIRELAYGYFHGHEVGGTNPSLLEALASTKLNLLLQVGFNQEVALEAALYWTKQSGNLAQLIEKADAMDVKEIEQIGEAAKKRIQDAYSWQYIVDRYAQVWMQ